MTFRHSYRFLAAPFLAVTMLLGCVGGPEDRAFIADARYREARRAFERTRSVEVARMAMEQAHWPKAMINEAVYRIEKEFGLKDELASPARVRGEEELRQEELADWARQTEFTQFSQLATQGLGSALQTTK